MYIMLILQVYIWSTIILPTPPTASPTAPTTFPPTSPTTPTASPPRSIAPPAKLKNKITWKLLHKIN